jgi:hypothetical protein
MDPQQVTRDPNGTLRCRNCGFAYNLAPGQIVDQAVVGLEAVIAAVASTRLDIRHVRPSPRVWSVNAYTAHLAEAMEIVSGRVRLMVEHDRPTLQWYDENETAERGRFDERPADQSVRQLEQEITSFIDYAGSLPPEAWTRPGIHSTAGEVRVSDIAHDIPHELHHHAADIRRVGASVS